MMRRWLTVLAVLLGVGATSELAQAQEIQLTGPLAGAPAVRKLRLRRQNRVEVALSSSFTLLDEFQRTILLGGRINYNPTDWLGIGVWGGAGVIRMNQPLTDHINDVTANRRATVPDTDINNRLTEASISKSGFKTQLGQIDWVVAPQLTLVPFRGKLAIFQKIFVDTDAYIFAGPAFVGLAERENCETECATHFALQKRTAITATFGLGLTFYLAKWASLGVEWRGLPFAWNTGGFDTRGGDPDQRFPDTKITDKDRDFRMNMLVGVNLGFYFPTNIKSSE